MKNLVFVLCLLWIAAGPTSAADKPYAGLEQREVKALSSQQIDDLRAGRGMGMALAAELNNYPGPRHVLDLAASLDLSADRHSRVSKLFDEMSARARTLGVRILAAEERLDRLFAENRVNEAVLRTVTGQIAGLRGDLRYVHLQYHLTVRALLSEIQIARYGELRGYGEGVRGQGARPVHGTRPAHGAHGSHQ